MRATKRAWATDTATGRSRGELVVMKVIKKGRSKSWKRRLSCYGCNALLEVLDTDCRYVSDQRDGDYYEVKCPECDDSITIAARVLRDDRPG